ncbi:hypothetical protein [Nocardiopsis sp. YSL2]|uniref:hypothetical protein n=1 Tax=Nocardiopsis sp. YSL2 TaxID=2939492 RepID=UPI0026F46A66|nr:hypothetical protein [Nocardiopsis sp. YSL2]
MSTEHPDAAASRPTRRAWALVAALAAAALVAGAPAPALAGTAADPAPASAEGASPASDGDAGTAEEGASPAQTIADVLAESPVHVSPAFDSAFPVAERERLAEVIAESGLDLYVIAVPLTEGDEWNGDADELVSAVQDRMGAEERHFLVHDGRRLQGVDFGPAGAHPETRPAANGAHTASYRTMGESDTTIAELVGIGVETALSDDPEAAYEQAVADYEAENGRMMSDGTTWLPWIVAAGAVAVLAVLGGVVLVRRSASPAVPLAQHAAFDNADRARLESLVERCDRDLIELGERLSQAGSTNGRRLTRALDTRDAAVRVYDRMVAEGPTLPDAVGVLVLLDLAEDALAGRRTPRRPCYANPLHGSDTRQVDWREFGGTRTIRVPLCSDCARAVRDRVRPTVLADEHEGRSVPYYEVPPEESVWAATGYGTLSDDLVERIQRGAHRTAR